MRRLLRNQLFKILAVYVFVVALAVWQHKFVMLGLQAMFALNAAIIGVFIFGAALTVWQMVKLLQEVTALDALKEAYEDARIKDSPNHTDPYWRHYRALQPGKVYQRPHTLGHFFELTLDEILRTRKLKITIGTLRDIVHGIEERIHEERSFIAYMTGLLIFMGLIGTFMGLMKMVASVGDIVGGLKGGGSGGFDALLTQLQAPLQGMAIGFSCSLFGLFTSLTLGLAAKFGNSAALSLKNEFEGWLSSAAAIENEEQEAKSDNASGRGGGGGLSKEALAQLVARTEHGLGKVAAAMQDMARAQAEQTAVLREASRGLERIGDQSTAMTGSIGDLAGATRKGFADTGAALAKVEQTSIKVGRELAARQSEATRQLDEAIRRHPALDEVKSILAALPTPAPAAPAVAPDLTASVEEVRAMARSIETGMSEGFDSVARSIEATLAQWAAIKPEDSDAPPAADTPPPPAETPPPEIDHDEMVRRLRTAIAEKFAPTGTNG